MGMPTGAVLVEFPDEMAMVVAAKSKDQLINEAKTGLHEVTMWMDRKLQESASEKNC